jgi:hypothetical protein
MPPTLTGMPVKFGAEQHPKVPSDDKLGWVHVKVILALIAFT